MTLELRDYQTEALSQIVAQRRLIYGDPVGSGKTATSLSALPALQSHRALVLAPTYLLDQWIREGERWVPRVEFILGAGSAAKRQRARGAVRESLGPSALVLNYEAAWRDVDELAKLGFDTIICDEAHRLKNRQSATFKQVSKLANRSENLILVTGTPILNRADELWSSLHLIDYKTYSSYWSWTKRHFEVETTDFHGTVARPVMLVGKPLEGHEALIRGELGERFIQRPNAMPQVELIETTIHVELSPAERKAYNELRRKSWTQIEGEFVQVVNEVAKTTRLRQLASEWGQLSSGLDGKVGAKVSATAALVADLTPEPVLVVAQYRNTVERIAAELEVPFIHGEMPVHLRGNLIGAFQDGHEIILVATQGVVSEGIDGFQHVCNNIVMVDRDWTPARNDQTIGRLRRSGQTRPVNVHYIVAKDTLDETVAAALESKQSVINAVLHANLEVH